MSRPSAVVASALAVISLAAVPAARQAAAPSSASPISAARIRADIEFLADDLLEGREAGTRGYDLAARFVATALEGAGYAPAADDGSYYQQVPFIESTPASSSMKITAKGATVDVALPDEAIVGPNSSLESSEINAPLVFAGYGVTAPEFGHDDYAGLDVKGKAVVVLMNAPAKFPSEPRAHYASNDVKLKNAADRGAVGFIVVAGPDDVKRFPWERVKSFFGRPTLTWAKPDGTPGATEPRIKGGAFVNPTGATRLFAAAPFTFEQAVESMKAGTPRTGDLNASVAITTRTTHKRATSPNVVARLEGSDPALKATSVVLTAHLDHIGISPTGEGDRINNGAYDNAAGSAILLEVARALASQPMRPKRSVLIVFVTAEEKGLLGSDYFARNPVKAAGKIVANVNLDMPVFLTASTDIVAFGSENSTLDAVVRQAVGKLGYTLSPDPMPEENIFVRSDQYSLVKQGVPAVYLMPGFTAKDAKVNGQQIFGGFLATHYHRPSDDLSLPMDLPAIGKFAEANLAVARAIADDPVAPAWKEGNFFGKIFAGTK